MKRRPLIRALMLLPFAAALNHPLAMARSRDDIATMRERWSELLAADFDPPDAADVVSYNAKEWRRRLGEQAYDVLREESTERSFSSPLNDEKRPGIYACAGCDLPLFSSEMKFDSGTGWPSFFTQIPDSLATKRDFILVWPRTEYHCIRCGGHQGHIFDDGPAPTGERWCNNGVALKFLPATG